MDQSILETIIFWVMGIISQFGYPGIFLLMTAESALIPIPSEVIMPFSGFLVSQGRFGLIEIALVGALGNLVGSWIAYGIGYYGHKTVVKKFVEKYGKYILLTEEEFDSAVNLFARYGQWVTAIARMLPAVRTVISLPAGIARLPVLKFSLLTFIGSFIWSLLLGYIGFVLGENWEVIRPYFRKFDVVIIIILASLVCFYLWHKFKKRKVS